MLEEGTMPQITIDISDKSAAIMKQFDISAEEAFDYGLELLARETPNEENLRIFEKSERDEGVYTAKDKEDLFKSLGLDKW
jgi:hypothetical protein